MRGFPTILRFVVLRERRWAQTSSGTVYRSAMIVLASAGLMGVPSTSQITYGVHRLGAGMDGRGCREPLALEVLGERCALGLDVAALVDSAEQVAEPRAGRPVSCGSCHDLLEAAADRRMPAPTTNIQALLHPDAYSLEVSGSSGVGRMTRLSYLSASMSSSTISWPRPAVTASAT